MKFFPTFFSLAELVGVWFVNFCLSSSVKKKATKTFTTRNSHTKFFFCLHFPFPFRVTADKLFNCLTRFTSSWQLAYRDDPIIQNICSSNPFHRFTADSFKAFFSSFPAVNSLLTTAKLHKNMFQADEIFFPRRKQKIKIKTKINSTTFLSRKIPKKSERQLLVRKRIIILK